MCKVPCNAEWRKVDSRRVEPYRIVSCSAAWRSVRVAWLNCSASVVPCSMVKRGVV